MGQDGVRQDGAAPYPDDKTLWCRERAVVPTSLVSARRPQRELSSTLSALGKCVSKPPPHAVSVSCRGSTRSLARLIRQGRPLAGLQDQLFRSGPPASILDVIPRHEAPAAFTFSAVFLFLQLSW
ncbi:hypothetical protein BS78_02G290500 [Paspalum vaginatum]|nr:hypothetical protein BS78_02G290500 [Paspalum vaginatum]